ncbi:MAG: hypothetical protein DME56_08625 [Verrucomicrobia bacterium]|nr:MAG: hypothetical protein DME56_08625 [Verrucomicrobiota bacterium]
MACHACLLANASGVASANAGLSDLTLPWLAVGSAKVATLQRFKRGEANFPRKGSRNFTQYICRARGEDCGVEIG